VNIIGGPSMNEGRDIKREAKTRRIKDHIVILENTFEQMMDTLCQSIEKVHQMEIEFDKMKHRFNEVIWECQITTYVMIDTLTNDIQDRLKAVEDTLVIVTQRLNDQDDIITLLKHILANKKRTIVKPMRNKIKGPKPYDGTHNAKLLGNLCWDIEKYLEQ
jgi:hypothetical protein